jgi:hypothetical protein
LPADAFAVLIDVLVDGAPRESSSGRNVTTYRSG